MMFWVFVGCSQNTPPPPWSETNPPSYSDYIRASKAGDDDLVKLLNHATELRVGLEFPRDTFAVDRKRGIFEVPPLIWAINQ